jgi:hypothetical protein
MSVQAVSQAIADVEKMEREEQAKRKALLEANTKGAEEKQRAAEGILEGVKMLMEMPATVETSVPEPQAVAEVIEVPVPGSSAGDLDIIIVDSSNLGGQEEVPPSTEFQTVEVLLDGKNDDASKPGVTSEAAISAGAQETLKDSGEEDVSVSGDKVAVEEQPQDSPAEKRQDALPVTCGRDSADVSETAVLEDSSEVRRTDEASKIENVGIEIPASKAEEGDCTKEAKTEELDREKEQSIKKEEDELVVEDDDKQGTPATDKAVTTGEQKETADNSAGAKDSTSVEDSEGQCSVKNEVKRGEMTEESLQDEAEESVERERAAGPETCTEQCEQEEEDLAAADPEEGSAKQSKQAEKEETEAEELATKVRDAAEIGEVTEEEDSRAESSEDEKKPDKKAWSADHGEEAILENARYYDISQWSIN